MAENKIIEEKSLSTSIEFTYQKPPGLFAFFKKIQLDFVTVTILILISIVAFYSYTYSMTETTIMKEKQAEISKYSESYLSLKTEIESIKNIKTSSFNGDRFVKIFKFLSTYGFEKYTLNEDKTTGQYSTDIENYPIEELKNIIEDGVKTGILSADTKKNLLISKPGEGTVKMIFK